MTYHLLAPDGAPEPWAPKGKRPSLEELQAIVGGWIERVRIPGGNHLWVNEEGLLLGLPRNPMASSLAGQTIVGTVLVCMRKLRKT